MPSATTRNGESKITVFRSEDDSLAKVLQVCDFLRKNSDDPELCKLAQTTAVHVDGLRCAIAPLVPEKKAVSSD